MDSIDQYIEKPEGESDLGPNADGMGVISSVPFAEEAFVRKVGKRDRKKPAIFDGGGGDGGTAGDFRVLLAAPLEKGRFQQPCDALGCFRDDRTYLGELVCGSRFWILRRLLR